MDERALCDDMMCCGMDGCDLRKVDWGLKYLSAVCTFWLDEKPCLSETGRWAGGGLV